jgi:hypothetical protein
MLRDFLGQEIQSGQFLAAGGNNRSAEYGMILYRVESVKDTSAKLLRIAVRYVNSSAVLATRPVTLRNPNAYVVVNPPSYVVDHFDLVASNRNALTTEKIDTITRWIHGAEHQRPWG